MEDKTSTQLNALMMTMTSCNARAKIYKTVEATTCPLS